MATPWPLPLGVSPGLNVCESEPDFYSFEAYAGYTIDVEVDFDVAEGDIELNLYDPDGVIIASANTSAAPETISVSAAMDGEYVLEIWLDADAGPVVGTDYSVDLEVIAGVCTADAYEPNEGAGGAYLLTAGGAFPGLTACYDVDDWYYIEPAAGVTIDVALAFLHAEGDLDLTLFDQTSNELVFSRSATDDEVLSHVTTYEGPHFIVVNLVADTGPNAGNTYDMTLTW
jgi:hypothetical protein